MKELLLIPSLCLLLLSCSSGRRYWTGAPESTISDAVFTQAQAERILGEPVKRPAIGGGHNSYIAGKAWEYTSIDTEQGGTLGKVILTIETYADSAEVPKIYSSIARKAGYKETDRIEGVGDEAQFMKSVQLYILARKGPHVIYFRVEPTTSRTSADEFIRVAGEIAAAL